MDPCPGGLGGNVENVVQFRTDGVTKGDMSNDALTEKGIGGAALGTVKELVGQDDVARGVVRLERTNCTDADDPPNAELLEAVDVGSVRDFARK